MNNELIKAKNDIGLSVDVDKALKEWNEYQKLTKRLLDENEDYQKYYDKETGEYIGKFKKTSAWLKYSRAFNIDTKIVDVREHRNKIGRLSEATYRIRATLPSGRSVVAEGSCDIFERGKTNAGANTILGTAETRATNRAIRRLIGAGEVGAEELDDSVTSSWNAPIPANKPKKEVKNDVEDKIIEVKRIDVDNVTYEDLELILKSICDNLIKEGKEVNKKTVLEAIRTQNYDRQSERKITAHIMKKQAKMFDEIVKKEKEGV